MARTFTRQDTQIRNSDSYIDNIVPTEAAFETNPTEIQTDLNNIRSQLHNVLKNLAGNWWDDLLTPSTFESGAERGVNDLNQDLHDFERKRTLRDVISLVDVTVGTGDNFVVLGSGELPANLIAAVGAVTTLGTVVAFHAGTFGTHSLDEVAGGSAITPANLVPIYDGSSRDPLLSSNRRIWGLLQTEIVTDGHTINITTQEVQISFVRYTASGDDLEAVPFADIEDLVVNYTSRERIAIEDLAEYDFLKGAIVDPPGSTTTDRQAVYNNQGATVVEVTTNSTLDLNSASVTWEIRDLASQFIFRITEGSGGSNTEVRLSADADIFNIDALVNDFAQGTTINSAGTRPFTIGVTDGEITTTAGDMRIFAAAELLLDDVNQTGSTWAQTTGIKLSDTTAEWDLAESNFGEVSILNMLNQAFGSGARGVKTYANCSSTTTADTDVGGVAGGANLDAQLPDMSGGTFVDDYDVFLNGSLLRGGVNAAANNDYYPGTSLPNGQLKFEFTVRINDVLCVIPFA